MNAQQFREFGYAAIDFVADYMENVHERFLFIEVFKIDKKRNYSIYRIRYFKKQFKMSAFQN